MSLYRIHFALLLAIGFLGSVSHASTLPDRYEVILTRHPFGSPPSAPPPAQADNPPPKPAFSPEQLSFAKNMRLCFIRNSGTGLRAGIADSASNWSAVLHVGESQDGVLLKDADYGLGKALLSKDSIDAWIYLNGSQPMILTQTGAGAIAQPLSALTPVVRRDPIIRRAHASPGRIPTKEEYERSRADGTRPPPVSPMSTLSPEPSGPALSKEEREAKLREYNMELIRAGGAKGVPLPIPLTPEEDAQLVREGVLPAP